MNSISNLFVQSQLALAAYATLASSIPDIDKLKSAGMSATQAEKFADTWRVVDQLNASDGLSATVFEEVATGKRYLAVRGTQPSDLSDLLTDFVDITLLGTPERQSQYATLRDQVAAWLADGSLISGFTVAGHSLGGFLAGALLADFSSQIEHAYLYNAPGVGGLSAGLRLLAGLEIEPTLNLGQVTNVISRAGPSLTAGLGLDWGAPVQVTIEDQSPNVFDNHSVVHLTDALAVQSLFALAAPSASLDAIGSVLRAGANSEAWTLEASVNSLGRLLVPGFAELNRTAGDDRDDLYARIQSLRTAMVVDPNAAEPMLKPGFQGLVFTSLVGSPPTDLADLAAAAGAVSLGIRYALTHLNDFALTDNADIYAVHNQNGELDLYNPATGEGTLTTEWLESRAGMLAAKLRFDSSDTGYGSELSVDGVDGDWDYIDLATRDALDHPLTLQIDGDGIELTNHQVVFGSDAGDTLIGFAQSDRLFGGDGNDTLTGNGGSDYLEGGRGNDRLLGDDGADRLVGGQGDDMLDGGTGNDTLDGGNGFDTYTFSTAEFSDRATFDIIVDRDGQGRILIDGLTLGSGGLAIEAKGIESLPAFATQDGRFRLAVHEDGARAL